MCERIDSESEVVTDPNCDMGHVPEPVHCSWHVILAHLHYSFRVNEYLAMTVGTAVFLNGDICNFNIGGFHIVVFFI
jgi:hypothetical protein